MQTWEGRIFNGSYVGCGEGNSCGYLILKKTRSPSGSVARHRERQRQNSSTLENENPLGGLQFLVSHRMIASSLLVYVGLISYGLYLWHWPLVAFARYASIPVHYGETRIVILALSTAAAAFSHRCLETPARATKTCDNFLLSRWPGAVCWRCFCGGGAWWGTSSNDKKSSAPPQHQFLHTWLSYWLIPFFVISGVLKLYVRPCELVPTAAPPGGPALPFDPLPADAQPSSCPEFLRAKPSAALQNSMNRIEFHPKTIENLELPLPDNLPLFPSTKNNEHASDHTFASTDGGQHTEKPQPSFPHTDSSAAAVYKRVRRTEKPIQFVTSQNLWWGDGDSGAVSRFPWHIRQPWFQIPWDWDYVVRINMCGKNAELVGRVHVQGGGATRHLSTRGGPRRRVGTVGLQRVVRWQRAVGGRKRVPSPRRNHSRPAVILTT